MGAERVSLLVYRVRENIGRPDMFDFHLEAGRDGFDRIDWPVNEAFEIVPKRADPTLELLAAVRAFLAADDKVFEASAWRETANATAELKRERMAEAIIARVIARGQLEKAARMAEREMGGE